MSAIEAYLQNNASFAAGYTSEGLTAAPSRRVVVVACMDARLEPTELLGLALGDAHVVRNAGGIATDDVLRSIAVSQSLLATREVMLIQHTRCGLHRGGGDDEIKTAIRESAGAEPPFALHSFVDLEQNVRESLSRIIGCPYLTHRDAVRGFVFEVETGLLREVT